MDVVQCAHVQSGSDGLDQCDGGCSVNILDQGPGPGYLIFAPNDYEGFGFGFRNSTICGTCFQITGATKSAIGTALNHCPDCAVLGPWFDMSQELADAIDMGANGTGNSAVSWREASCEYTTNVLCEVQNISLSSYFMRLVFG
jgi:hypothetical protein